MREEQRQRGDSWTGVEEMDVQPTNVRQELGEAILARRCFTSSISASGIETVNGRTRAEVGAGAVIKPLSSGAGG